MDPKEVAGLSFTSCCSTLKKLSAYGTLLAKLFQQESPKAPCARSAAATAAATPPRNKVLMISLDLRLSGCQEEAEKLEELLWKLGDGPASGLGELDSVLELLVQLAGSVPPPPASFNRDYMRRERPVLRRPPLTGYHSKELQQLEARAWSLVCREEWGALGAQQRTLGLMDGLPGTGLPTLGRWSDGEDRFERETRLSLFGALQNTRTTDLDIRLDLPPVPSNIEVTGLAIRVPPAFDQSEDEGFQSASNLTPDSQSEPSPSPEVDVWEALRNFEPSWRRCWENVGWPPGKKEDPYLTEAGREAFDHLYRLREGEMRVVCSDNSALPPTPQHSQKQLVADFLNVLIGVTSDTFLLNQVSVQFEVRPGVCVSGASPESISRLLAELAQYGTHYLRLSRFSLQSAHQRGLVFQAFTGGLRRYLQYYRACVLSTPPSLSLLTIGFLFRKLGRQLRYLSELCCVDGNAAVGQTPFPVGVRLLSYLYNEALSNCSNENYPVLLSLLKSSCEPYTRFVSDWVYSGVFRDVYKEFMIQVNEDYLSYRDKHFWVQGYTLISQDVEECVPVFLRHIANDVYVCGKTINLLKICCPQHYICWSELPVPRIAVTFSMQEVEEIERDCAVYRGRMERIAKHSALSREEQILHTEQARQELISHVRESTAKTLETIRGINVATMLKLEAKKRERFEEIKHHLEQEREVKLRTRKEQEDDFSFARELRDREKRLRALEEQLERRTKKELIAQYSRMSEEATRRERRAVWRVQRLQLNEARTQFLEEDQRLIQVTMGVGCVVSGVPEAPTAVYDGLQNTQDRLPATSSLPPPSLPPLHNTSICSRTSDSHILDQLDLSCFEPKSPRLSGSGQVDRALQDIGSELSEGNNTSVKDDYDFSAPYSPLQDSVARARWGPTVQPGFTCLAEQSRDPQIQGSEHLSPKAESENVPGARVNQTPFPGSSHGHAADSFLIVGCVVSGTEPIQKVLPNRRYGNASDSTLEVGCIVSGTEPVQKSLPGSSYGHASDSTLEVGCIVSGTEPVQKSLPGSSYGHASDSTLEVGCIVSGTEPVQKSLPGSSYGHASDSTLEPGCVFSGTEPVQKSLPGSSYGHASDSTLEPGCVFSGTEPVQKPLPGSSYGHASDSTLGVGCVVSGTEPVQRPLPGSSYGHASDSTLGVGCVVSGTEPVQKPLPGSSYGHASDSTLECVCVYCWMAGSEAGTPDEARDLMESSSAWVKASGIQPGDRTEQDYLHSLAAQYEVEQYQDDYRILSESQTGVTLHQVTRGPYGFPGSGGMRDATDTTAVQLSEMVSLPVLIKHSVTTPLSTHVSLVNKAVVDYFFVELGVEKHFEALRHFLLMEDGEFAQSLSDLLFEKLASGQTPGELLTPLVLNSILSKALQYSLHGGGALAANFTFALRFLPERFHPHAPDVLQCLELRYKVDWPLNIVITDNCMNKYNRLFSFLLQLKHMVWTLRDVWFHLKRAALVKGASHSTQFRQLQLYRHEMQHFVKVIQGYIANQILQVSWSEFIHKLGNVSDLDSIHHTHADYLNRAIFRGLLTEKAAPVMNIIHSIFSLILKFRAQLIAQPWSSQQGETVHPSFVAMQQSYNTFKYYSHFLFKVVTKLVNRGYQPHLEDFLLRINFNNYYKDS
uniref:Tubulin gamma complex component 6 n=1 Tax=Scleropages formosus TaxID=113540 RepID=A0A8C9QUP2_SCLFO